MKKTSYKTMGASYEKSSYRIRSRLYIRCYIRKCYSIRIVFIESGR